MQRVLIIGSGGAGKSTFATELGRRTGLPVVHLDAHYFTAGWTETPKDEWARRVEQLAGQSRWIIDGNYIGTMDTRLAACDTVVFLDLPRTTCLWRAFKRLVRYRGHTRPDMAAGCVEKMDWEFVQWIWNYPKQTRPAMMERLARFESERNVVILRSSAEVEGFLAKAGGIRDDKSER